MARETNALISITVISEGESSPDEWQDFNHSLSLSLSVKLAEKRARIFILLIKMHFSPCDREQSIGDQSQEQIQETAGDLNWRHP